MTATQAPAVEATDVARDESTADLAGVLGSADHKVIGRLYVGAALMFGLASAVAGVLAGIDRIDGELGNTILATDTAPQVLSFHRLSVPLLCLIPALLGLAMIVVPLQVGARAIAFPRAAAASFWGWIVGAATFAAAFALNGGPGGGRSDAVDLWLTATALITASLLLGAVCVGATVLAARTRDMTLDRVPFFSWSMLCTTAIWLLTLPVLLAITVLLYVDHRFADTLFGAGGALDSHLDWINRAPQVYALAIPLLGVALDAVATASGRRFPNRGVAFTLIGAFAALGIGAFALPTLVPAAADQPVTKGMALLVVLPVLGLVGLVGTALKDAKPQITSGLVAGVVGLLVLLLATLVGAAVPFQSLLELQGTQWISAHSHLVTGAALIGLVGGLYHWSTKIVGLAGNEALGRTAPVLIGLGVVLVAAPEAVSGLVGDAEEAVNGLEVANVVSVVGAAVLLLGSAVAVAGLARRRHDDEPSDPWAGQTLEWATASPPSFDNFDGEVPAVDSAEPLLAVQSEEGDS